MAPRCAST